MNKQIEILITRIGEDLQTLEDYLQSNGDMRTNVRFPRGFLRQASHFRRQFWFIRSENLRRNVAYTLILSDLYRWLLNRTDLWGTAREMIIKETVCLMGSLAESVTKDALIGVCGKKTNYKKRIEKLKELQVIDSSLKKELEWLWDYRNREHLFLVEEWEYGHYELRHSNRAIRAMQALRTGLDKYFRNAGFDS